jgi:hypothetical protein
MEARWDPETVWILWRREKPLPLPGIEPLVRRNTGWAIPASIFSCIHCKDGMSHCKIICIKKDFKDLNWVDWNNTVSVSLMLIRHVILVANHWPPDRKTTLVPLYLFLISPVVCNQPHGYLQCDLLCRKQWRRAEKTIWLGFVMLGWNASDHASWNEGY